MMSKLNLIIIGASGHGKVVAEIAENLIKYSNIYFIDDYSQDDYFHGYKILQENELSNGLLNKSDFFVAIGNNEIRKNKLLELKKNNYTIATLIDKTAIVSNTSTIQEGSVVMAGAIINASVNIGIGVIVNTRVSIDHDSNIGDYSHISPGSVIAGTVNIGKSVWLGANSSVINNIEINDDTIIGAGGVVIRNIEEPGTYVGLPVKKIK